MTSISEIKSIIIEKNMLCTNKIRVIYICPNCINFLPKNVYLFILFIYIFYRLWHRCSPVNFATFILHLLLQNNSGGCFWTSFKQVGQQEIRNAKQPRSDLELLINKQPSIGRHPLATDFLMSRILLQKS